VLHIVKKMHRNIFPYPGMWKVPIGMRLSTQVKYGTHWEKFVKAQDGYAILRVDNMELLSRSDEKWLKYDHEGIYVHL